MKVLILTTNNSSPKGGSEKLWRELAKGLVGKGAEVVASVYHHQARYQASKLPSDVTIHRRIPKRFGKSLLQRIFYYFFGRWQEGIQIRQVVQRENPNHIFISFGGFAELDNPRLLKTLQTLNCDYSAVFHSNTEDYSFQPQSIVLAREFCVNANKVYLVSHRIGQIFQRQVAFPNFAYEVIANPMTESPISSLSIYDDPISPVKLAFIGTLDVSVKGIALLIQSMASNEWPNNSVTLDLYGEGKDRELIETLISEFHLKNSVKVMGWTDDIDKVWNDHHILVLPSFNEGMPMVIHEAMLRQRIVIATDVGGNSEVIDHGKTGFLAPSASLAQLNHAFNQCFHAREQWSEIAAAARDSILKSRSHNETIESIIKKVVNEQD